MHLKILYTTMHNQFPFWLYFTILQLFIEYVKATLKDAVEGRSVLNEDQIILLGELLPQAEELTKSIVYRLKKSSSNFKYFIQMFENPVPIPSRLTEMNYQHTSNEVNQKQFHSIDHFMMDMMGSNGKPKCTFTGNLQLLTSVQYLTSD